MCVQRNRISVYNSGENTEIFFKPAAEVSLCKKVSKVVAMLNQVPHNKDTWSSGGEAVCILILGTRWGEGSALCPLYFNPGERTSGTH
jgi:hypothetical protein